MDNAGQRYTIYKIHLLQTMICDNYYAVDAK